ncbi:undecaprenyl-diphosphate phosphatase [Svornostia abyssi]|uniref:Undecaprenyl-diphosphatase n=1 Tax=Svornostia abyssi TaxID=2898438 RepID=A0ABY5PC64_9ACTN|nr:undecaprenyl-diphosphate phosphatase [Parviterribacteraceae bacterium J379]
MIAAVDPLNYAQAIVLGVVQGLTEFLPISSSAHLRIVAALAGWGDPGAAFTAVTQIGTETAVVLYFRHDIVRIARAWLASLPPRRWPDDPDARLGWLVLLGSVPIVVLGLALEHPIDSAFRDLRLIALAMIGFALLLGWADRRSPDDRDLVDLTVRDGLIYGLAQAMALIPGVSRSGGTITAGRLLGYSREAATRFAFLLAIPAVLGSGVYKLKDIGGPDTGTAWGPTVLATVIAFAVGYAVIAWLMRYLKTGSYLPFVVYRVALGVLVLVLVTSGAISPESGYVAP